LAGQLAIAIQNSKLFTEQERLTAEMQSNANFLDTIIDSLPLMIFVKDAQDLRFLRYNQAGSDLLGIPVEELVGKTDYDFFPKEEADFFTRKDREVLETGAIVDIPQESIQTAHKGTRYLHTTKVPILDDQGQPQYLLGIAEDITERKAIESELTKFKLGMERSADAIFLTDNDGVITYVNDAFVDIYGYAKEEAIGQTPRIIKSGLIPQENYEYFWQTLLSGGIIAGEIINKTKDGRLVNIEGNNNPIQDESGQIIGFLAMHRDITERKQVEKTLEKQAIELQTVADLSTQVSLIEDPQKMLEMVVQETQKRFGLYHCHVFLMDDAGKQLSIRACGWHQDAPQYGTHGTATLAMDSQKSLVVQAALNRQAVVVNDVLNDPNWLPNELLPDTRSELAVPLIVGNKVLGVLDVQATEVDYFTANDIQIQSTLAAQIAVALENARAFAQANEQVSIIQSAPNIIATASLDGIVRFMNQVGLQQLGYSLDELIGQHVSIFDPPDRDPRQRQEAMAYLQQHGIWQGESTIVTKSGGLIPVEQIISLIRDEQGKPVMTAVNMTDITARKQAEEAIRRNETLMRTIIDSTPDWIFVKDSQHRYQMVNKAYAETTHLEPDALIGKTVLDIGLPREIAETLLAEDEALMESEETMVIAEEELLLNGEKRYQTLTKVLLRDESGQIQNMVGYAHDVTKQVASANEQKQLQQELEAQLERVNALQRAMTRESWQAFMTTTADKRPFQGFEFNQTGLKTLTTQDLINGKNKANEASGANGHNELISPVKIQDTVIGKIGVRNPDGTPISEEKRNLLISLTAQVAEALDRARLFEETELGRQEIETQAAELSTVNEISELVSTQLNINDLVNAVGDRLIETFSADSVYIALVDEKTSTINFPYFTNRVDGPMNVPPRTLDNKGGFTAQIYQSRQPIINNPVDQTVADAVAASGGEIINTSIDSNTYIGVPMIVGEAVIGVIGLNGQQERRKYDKEDIPLLTTLSSTIAVALQNAQQFEATQRRANRESMVNEISQKIQNAPTVESALQTAVAELGKALNLKHAVVRLNKPE
ncbi:MAG: PAS domain S-box protein, partial [Anaerolineae bacterium]|nr:PAS domain S-box protein [Anaerolineae bacterium]